ncbi:hypothetical protein Pmar_PMAR012362 [Perkinsus marinus ATCC 50983]|uniref:Small nuclear ribonucleoprotein Prp3 C-terminal domain-containing protein n=1 Tax=Perkinsus marinus (strain ATCC 50983 / TXsc) TaxID=423536 RepID=C5K751_PERM5|nr:hypothetical protein Pmar_PMAR012362 [Perkinsus marinus ATCC 50983]EER19386.1 hypothetical protein Pmar_PMAR012362 [Perkinsus marinus ATCC 50983]|eukprot:XP_002787590.1 hypothetical protein Pmar_PMAR012362 [Perkinsus marinus ATCC 50983]
MEVQVMASSVGRGSVDDIVGRSASVDFRTKNEPSSWVQVDFGRGRTLRLTGYCLRNRNSSAQCLMSWNVMGSNDGDDWVILDEKKMCGSLREPKATSYFPIEKSPESRGAFRVFRLVQGGVNSVVGGRWILGDVDELLSSICRQRYLHNNTTVGISSGEEPITGSHAEMLGEEVLKYLLKHVRTQLESGYVFPLIAAVESTRQYITQVGEDQQDANDNSKEENATSSPETPSAGREVLGRRMMVVHTIKNPMKIKFIRELAKDYRLGGMSNPNFIVIEGEESLCADYVNRVTRYVRMVTVRGEEQIEVPMGKTLDEMRAFPVEFTQYKVDEVSEIAQRCRDAGLEELFMTSMKMYTTSSEDDNKGGDKKTKKNKKKTSKKRGIDTLEKPFRENNCLNLQLDEAEALECVYGRQPDSDFMWLHRPKDTHDGEATYAITVGGDVVGDDDDDDEDEVEEDDEPYATFIITLPPGYPRERRVLPEVIAVEGSKSISPKLRRLDEALMASIKIQIEAGYDYPLLAALEQARVSINEIAEASRQAERARRKEHSEDDDDAVAWAARVPIRGATKKVTVHLSARKKKTDQPPMLGRRVIYAHHIRNPVKKKLIKEWAKEFHMGGCYKWGYPGVIILEGDEQDCAEYVNLINRLRWMYLAVRGEEQIPVPEGKSVDDLRAFPKDEFIEYGPDQMSDIAARCREYGLEELFLTCMKMYGPVRATKKEKPKKN